MIPPVSPRTVRTRLHEWIDIDRFAGSAGQVELRSLGSTLRVDGAGEPAGISSDCIKREKRPLRTNNFRSNFPLQSIPRHTMAEQHCYSQSRSDTILALTQVSHQWPDRSFRFVRGFQMSNEKLDRGRRTSPFDAHQIVPWSGPARGLGLARRNVSYRMGYNHSVG